MPPKAKAAASRPAAQKAPTAPSKAEVARLVLENKTLLERLAAAEQKLALLERQRDEALNRIEWAMDALQTLTDEVVRSV